MELEFEFNKFIEYKNITESTKSIYKSNYNTLNKIFNKNKINNNVGFLFDTGNVLNLLKQKYTIATIKNYVAFIVNVLRYIITKEMNNQILNESLILNLRNIERIYGIHYSECSKIILKQNEKYNDIIRDSDSFKKVFKISMADIHDYRLQYKNWIVQNNFLNSSLDFVSIDLFNKIQYYIIICLYSLIPPRRSEYGCMRIITYTQYINYNSDKLQNNFLVVDNDNNKMYFLFAKFKTHKRFGNQLFEIKEELYYIIKKWLNFTKSEYLLINNKGKPLNNAIISRFTDSFRLLTGDFYTLNITEIRSIYISECINDKSNIDKMASVIKENNNINIKNKRILVKFN